MELSVPLLFQGAINVLAGQAALCLAGTSVSVPLSGKAFASVLEKFRVHPSSSQKMPLPRLTLFIRAAAQRNEHQTAAGFAEEFFRSPNTAIPLCKKGGKKGKIFTMPKKDEVWTLSIKRYQISKEY